MCHKLQKDIFLSSFFLQIASSDAFNWGFPGILPNLCISSFPTFHKSQIRAQVVIIAQGEGGEGTAKCILVRAGVYLDRAGAHGAVCF